MKLRRTLLWVIGDDEAKLREAINNSYADTIVLELEDMCPASHKLKAREFTVQALKTWDFRGKERGVRINGLDTEWGRDDLEAVLPCVPDVIRLPKCETREDVIGVDAIITQYELTHGINRNTIELILMIETPLGLQNAYEMAKCSKRVTGLGFGAGDFTCALNVDRDLTPGTVQLLYAKQKLVYSASAAGIQAYDTTVVCLPEHLNEMNAFIAADTANIKQMGFSGRSVSMMPQIDIINQIFAPSEKDVAHSHHIIEGYEKGLEDGLTEIWIDGVYVDPPVIEKAKRIIELADAIVARHGVLR